MSYHRVVVVGGPGSGKTTLAQGIARRLGLPHTELDRLWWWPDWTPAEESAFTAQVASLVHATPAWVLDGNYFDQIARLVWPAADVVVWLDLPRAQPSLGR